MKVLRVAAVVAVLLLLPAVPAHAGANRYYYTVAAAHQGAPENLWEIADRFLGDANRAGEILDLNAGRIQPDGGRLSDPGLLTEGWHLILPADAVGTGVRHGPLPASGPAAAACPGAAPAATSWGRPLLAPDRIWSTVDGAGIDVAVIGAGVDGTVPPLAGRVAPGTDLLSGDGRADTGCEGRDTALALIVAGDQGIAPGARIVPVTADPARTAAAIHVASHTGARVILAGAGVDAADPAIRAAITDAIARDVVVVLPATPDETANAGPADGLLRVGAITESRQPARAYPAGATDLLAPGEAGSEEAGGEEIAAAYVAGAIALVRAAHPVLSAAEAARQLRDTAADGLVDPVAAITTPLPAGVGVNAAPAAPTSRLEILGRVLIWAGVVLAALAILAYLLPHPARLLAGAAARGREHRQAMAARARVSDDADDPFWQPPVGGPARPAPAEPDATQEIHGSWIP